MNFSKYINATVSVMALVAAVNVTAQSNNEALEHELNQLYQKQLAAEKMIQEQQKPQKAEVVVAPTAAAAAAPTTSTSTSVQVNVAPTVAAATSESLSAPMAKDSTVHQSPATQIEAAPLANSRADQLRKARQDVEVQTEQAIVEQLEASRLEWEKKRADALLKNISKQDDVVPAQPAVQAIPVEQAAPVVVVPAAVTEQQKANDAAASAEINALKQDIKDLKQKNDQPKSESYMSLGFGMPNYRNVINLKSDASFGLSLGVHSPNNVVFEGSFYYSSMRIERPTTSVFGGIPEIDNVDQYNGIAAVKYTFVKSKMRPLLGALASYTYRDYSFAQCVISCPPKSSSHALDAGFLIGGEVDVSDTLSVGVEYQYLRNLSNRLVAPIQPSFTFAMYPTGRLEESEYSLFTVRARFAF